MSIQWRLTAFALLSVFTFLSASGCKPSASDSKSTRTQVRSPRDNSVQTEEGWMVRSIAKHLAELRQLEAPESTPAELSLRRALDGEESLAYEVTVSGATAVVSTKHGVWNPGTYAGLAKSLFPSTTSNGQAVSLPDVSGSSFARRLLTPDIDKLVAESTRVATFVGAHPRSPEGHVQAALLLGTLALNDHAGTFRDVRTPLNRLVAHLTLADAFGAQTSEPSRRLAEALRLTLIGQQADALAIIGQLPRDDAAWTEWAALLRLRNTCDWREGRETALHGSDALKLEYFRALTIAINADAGVQFLREGKIPLNLGFARIANETGLSVGNGHVFTKPIFGAEIAESAKAAKALGLALDSKDSKTLFAFLDAPVAPSVRQDEAGRPVLKILGPDVVADFEQRHLMQGLARLFAFLNDKWGVPDSAQELASAIDTKLPPLRFTPFLKRINARTQRDRQACNAACETVIREQPQIVTSALWVSLRDDQNDERVMSFPDHHGWFKPEVPQGTAFESGARLYEIGVGDENDAAWLAELSKRAPYDYELARYNALLSNHLSSEGLPSATVVKWMGPLSDYHLRAMRLLANTQRNRPDAYRATLAKMSSLDPNCYLELGSYLEDRGLAEAAADAYWQGFEKANDRVWMANMSLSLVRHLHDKGDSVRAEQVANDAAEVYSRSGLATRIWLFERQNKWDDALETARKLDERYNQGTPSSEVGCLVRLHAVSPENAKRLGYEQKIKAVFPGGLEHVSLEDFQGPPKKGVSILTSTRELTDFGLSTDMVIVALDGFRTDTMKAYLSVREFSLEPELTVIAWDGNGYRTFSGKAKGRRFGVDLGDYSR